MLMLGFKILVRPGSQGGGGVVHASQSCDFTIDDVSLLDLLVEQAGGHKDFLGCFARGWQHLNDHSLKQLLLQAEPETESGRRLLYVCPECADIGCGAYGCKITKWGDRYIWSDFAYENGYETPEVLPDIGPFEFEAQQYVAMVKAAHAL